MRVSAARPRHSPNSRFLPSLAPKPLCRGVVSRVFTSRNRQDAASVVRLCRAIGSHVGSNAQSHKRLCDTIGSRKGGSQRVHSKQYVGQDVLHSRTHSQHWSIDQTGRVPSIPIYLIPTLPELSSNILSRNFRTILVYSGSSCAAVLA